MVADAPTDRRERVVHLDDTQCICPAALANKRYVTLGALSCRTCIAARSDASFFDGVGVGDSLRVEFEDCAAWRKPFIETVGQ